MGNSKDSSHNQVRSDLVEQLIRESGTSLTIDQVIDVLDEEYDRLNKAVSADGDWLVLTYQAALRRLCS